MAALCVLLWFVFVAMVSCEKTTGAKDMVPQDRSGQGATGSAEDWSDEEGGADNRQQGRMHAAGSQRGGLKFDGLPSRTRATPTGIGARLPMPMATYKVAICFWQFGPFGDYLHHGFLVIGKTSVRTSTHALTLLLPIVRKMLLGFALTASSLLFSAMFLHCLSHTVPLWDPRRPRQLRRLQGDRLSWRSPKAIKSEGPPKEQEVYVLSQRLRW